MADGHYGVPDLSGDDMNASETTKDAVATSRGRFQDKVVVVTGAASNIGRAIALAFAREGAKVAILDLDVDEGENTARQARACAGHHAKAYRADITRNEMVLPAIEQVLEDFGAINILVNNAGWTRRSRFLELDLADCQRIVDINLTGTINMTRAVLPHMVARREGVIVNVGSDAARIGEKYESVYGACKAGVISLTKTLAREHARDGIRLNVVCPGAVVPTGDDDISTTSLWHQDQYAVYRNPETQRQIMQAYPLGRLATAADVYQAVLFFASEEAGFVTGQTLSVSGGYTMC